MDKQPVVTVENVTKTYGKQGEKQTPALKGVSFQVEPGEFVGIMGASGSGKTTLLNILSTLDTPTSGSVRIKGADVTKLKGDALSDFRAKKIGFIFQDFNLLENLTGRENIALPLALQNVSAKKQTEAVDKIAQTLGIERVLDHYPTELSGGQKQRVAAARALVQQPDILFGDAHLGFHLIDFHRLFPLCSFSVYLPQGGRSRFFCVFSEKGSPPPGGGLPAFILLHPHYP